MQSRVKATVFESKPKSKSTNKTVTYGQRFCLNNKFSPQKYCIFGLYLQVIQAWNC